MATGIPWRGSARAPLLPAPIRWRLRLPAALLLALTTCQPARAEPTGPLARADAVQATDDFADAGGQADPDRSGGTSAILPPILVQAAHAAAPASDLLPSGDTPLERSPLAIERIEAADLVERGAQGLSSAIRTDPALGDNYNTFGYVEGLQVRGFTLDELLNYQRDGLMASSHVPVPLENKERIDVLKGVSGMLAGSSAPGGLVDFVLKQPTAQPLAQVQAQVSERGSVLLRGDFGGHAGADGRWGYRINAAAESRDPQIDHAWSKRAFLSGFFDWHATAGTTFALEFEHQNLRAISVPGYGLLDSAGTGVATTLPAPIDPRINLNDQPWTQPFESVQTAASLRWEQALAPGWLLLVKAGTQRTLTNDRIAFPDGCSAGPVYVYNGLCGNGDVDIYQYISDGERRNTNAFDARLHGQFALAGAAHELTLGVRSSRYAERYPPQQTYTWVGTVNVYAPVPLPAQPSPNTLNAPTDTSLQELYGFDVAHWGRAWSSWLGLRASRIERDSALTDGSESTRLQQHAVTPWLGLGLEPWQGGFAYLTWGSGVEAANAPNHAVTDRTSGQSWQLVNRGQVLAAQESRQWEAGLKQSLGAAGDALRGSLTAALYRIDKPFADNQYLGQDAQGNGLAVQVEGARVERHQGLELEARLALAERVQWRAALALLDARTTRALDPSWVGKPVVNTAPVALALENAWSPASLPALSWRNLFTFDSHKAVLPDGSLGLPDAWQWDSSLRYVRAAAGMRWTYRAGIDNVTDRRYWREAPIAPWGSIYLFPAAARSARASVQLDW